MSNKNNEIRQRKIEDSDNNTKNAQAATNPPSGISRRGGKKKRAFVPPLSGTRSTLHRMWTRTVLMFCLMVVVYFFTKKEKDIRFAPFKEYIPQRFQKIICSASYLSEIAHFPGCVPKTCGRFVTDTLINEEEIENLLDIATKGLNFGGSSGGASILDLHSGALSKGENFISIYNLPDAKHIFDEKHILTYQRVKAKIKQTIAEKFQISEKSLHLTHPTFFSRIENKTAKTVHDEYWHPHVDKETYSSFHYTSLLYLADFGNDFTGGRFIFIDGGEKNKTQILIEPKKGRVSFFTSGAENLHYVEKVQSGVRYAVTISFTCDPKFAIADPTFSVKQTLKNNSKIQETVDQI